MEDENKKLSRFPLRLPPDVDAEVRALARGEGDRPPSGINETIVFLLREALKARKEKREKSPGPRVPVRLGSLLA